MSFNVALPSEELEARKVDSSLKRKGASSEHAKEGAAEGGVQFNAQWHQLATRVEASSVHRAENSSAGEEVLEGVGEEVNSEKAVVASAGMQARLGRMSGKGCALPESARAFFEPRLGSDLGRVRVHTGAEAAGTARELDAQAFTAGCDIFFAAGQYKPDASEGKRLLAHELAHVARQGESAGGATLIHRKKDDALKKYKPTESVDYRVEELVDAALQAQLGNYIADKVKKGVKIEGNPSYLKQKKFEEAYADYSGTEKDDDDVKNIGGFYNRAKSKIVLPERPTLEALLHESIHRYQDSSFKAFGNGVNEAVTQYFTNYVLKQYGLPSGQGHVEKVVVAEALAGTVGFDELARAYFIGPVTNFIETLKKKIPGFDHVKVMQASAGGSVDWKKVAEMFQVPPANPKK